MIVLQQGEILHAWLLISGKLIILAAFELQWNIIS